MSDCTDVLETQIGRHVIVDLRAQNAAGDAYQVVLEPGSNTHGVFAGLDLCRRSSQQLPYCHGGREKIAITLKKDSMYGWN